jgi:hypothetical protein
MINEALNSTHKKDFLQGCWHEMNLLPFKNNSYSIIMNATQFSVRF